MKKNKDKTKLKANCFHCAGTMMVIATKVVEPTGDIIISSSVVPYGIRPIDFICGFDRYLVDMELGFI